MSRIQTYMNYYTHNFSTPYVKDLTFFFIYESTHLNHYNREERIVDYIVHLSFSRSCIFWICCGSWLSLFNWKYLRGGMLPS